MNANITAELEALRAQVEASTAIETSAVTLINGIAAQQQAAVDAALANGATEEQLKPITDFTAALNQSGTALSAAIAANTPAAPAAP